MNKYRVVLLVGAFLSTVTLASNDPLPDCRFLEYPNTTDQSLNLEQQSQRLEQERQHVAESIGTEMHEGYKRHVKNIELYLIFNQARKAAVDGSESGYLEAMNRLRLFLDGGIPNAFGFEYLKLYLYSHDLPFQNTDSALVGASIAQVSQIDYSQYLPPGDFESVRRQIGIATALFDLSQGNQSTARSLIESIPVDSQPISDIYTKGYLLYKIASQNGYVPDLESAIELLSALTNDSKLKECNRTLLGMSQYFIADSHLSIAQTLIQKKMESRSIRAELIESNNVMERARSNLDVIYVPGLWSAAYAKSSEIYGLLAVHEDSIAAHNRYAILESRAWAVSRLH